MEKNQNSKDTEDCVILNCRPDGECCYPRGMSLDSYQAEAYRTAGNTSVICCALGLAGESGEFADRIKKESFHGHETDMEERKKELGDILWYVAIAAGQCGFTLEEIAKANIEKLRKRYPDGWSEESSRNRHG